MKTAASFPGPRILVVDDEPANVALLRMILAAAGYKRFGAPPIHVASSRWFARSSRI